MIFCGLTEVHECCLFLNINQNTDDLKELVLLEPSVLIVYNARRHKSETGKRCNCKLYS